MLASPTPDIIAAPRTIEETGIRRIVLEDLALKILHLSGEQSLRDLAERMHIPIRIVNDILGRFRKENLCQVTGMAAGIHRIVTTSEGRERASELLSITQYAGPVPVSLDDYVAQTALANPHAEILYRSPKGEEFRYERIADDLTKEPLAIRPHPYGVELGILIRMLKETKSRSLAGALQSDFSRVSSKIPFRNRRPRSS